ncbi:MAG: hypothetical protein K6G46_10430 [Prevotella sp.]|nr:hypothetical protein [Prevotella sp.]
MRNLYKYTFGVLLAGLTMTACSPEEFEGADINGVPTVSGTDFTITVDQETNQMIANYTPAQGTYPIWILNGTSYSTLQQVGYQNPEAGTYSVELKLGNRNGFSQTGITKTFTFNETKVDYSADFRRLCDKEWRISNKEVGHMGCGPAGTAASDWWSAQPDDKKDFGVYDDRITFTADTRKGGTFTYDAGKDGLTYVNTGTTKWGSSDADFDVAIGNQITDWSFEVYDWEDTEGKVSKQTFIQLGSNTAFPYISSDAQYENPKFRIESLTAKKMVLVYDAPDRSIAWRFILTSEAEEKTFNGFDPKSDCNMFKTAKNNITFWYADENWAQRPDPTMVEGDNNWLINLPLANTQQWQSQMAFHTDMATNAATNYDFSILITSDKDLAGATVKLTQEDNDDNFFFADRVDLKAGEEYIFWKSDMPGLDINNVKLVLDFGGCQDDTNIEISSFVLKEHSCDDGTVLPKDKPGGDEPKMDWDPKAASNLWTPVESGEAFISVTPWFANDSWTQIGDPAWSHDGDVWTVNIPEGMGGSQWQGQFPINTSLKASAGKKYNFYCVLEADNDCPGVTIKLTESDDAEKHDQNFFFADRHDVKADVPYIYKAQGVSLPLNDAHALSLFFDFGGTPIGTNIKISKIYLEEVISMSYEDENNLWKNVDDGSAFVSVTPWFANGSWQQIGDPVWSHDGNKWTLTIPEGMGGDQWQGQFPINTTLATAQADAYNFSCTILADNDCPGVTIKLTESDDAEKHDDNFYFADRHVIAADEAYVYKVTGVVLPKNDAHALSLFFDFGGTPVGTNITISDIIFEKAN